MGGRRFRQAAADDGAAVHHRLDHRQPRIAQPVRASHAGPARRRGDRRAVDRRADVRVPDSADLPVNPKRVVLQLEPGRAPAPFDFVALYVPSNPFNALANNIVPAVVLFSIVLGSALVGVDDRERLLDVLHVARDAIARATRFVTRLTPYGLFAIAANAAGTLDLAATGPAADLSRSPTSSVALLVSLWVLPGLVAALTPIRARDMLRESQDSLLTAAIAGDLFIVLPGTHGGQPPAARPARSRQRRSGPPHRSHRAGVVQLSAHRQAAVAELHAVRRLVRRRRGAGLGLSAAGTRRAWSAFSAA